MIIKEYQRLAYASGEGGLRDGMALSLWLKAYADRNRDDIADLIVAYVSGATITDCLDSVEKDSPSDVEELLDWFLEELRKFPVDELFERVRGVQYALRESVENVPQLSSFDGSTLNIVDLLSISDTPLTYVRIGYQLYASDNARNETAKRKYGENAAKFAALLDLVRLGHDIKDPSASNRVAVELTKIGKAVARAKGDRQEIVARLLLRLALFRDLIGSDDPVYESRFSGVVSLLGEQTRKRRASAFSAMLHMYKTYGGTIPECSRAEELLWKMRH